MNRIIKFTSLFLVSLLLGITPVFSSVKKGIKIDVQLSPAGSFEATTSRVVGKAVFEDGSVKAKKIFTLAKTLKTGMDLRDEHLRKKFTISKILVTNAIGKDGSGKGTININGVNSEIKFNYKKIDDKLLRVTFELSLKVFKIEGISYMGVGVEDKVKVEAIIPYK
jgi:hypothetical protein